jgi:hypothetical protein
MGDVSAGQVLAANRGRSEGRAPCSRRRESGAKRRSWATRKEPRGSVNIRRWFAAGWIAAVVIGAGFSAGESPVGEVPLKEITEGPVVYVETRGPYWRIGAALADVLNYRREHNLAGAVFVRFLQDPVRTPPTMLGVQLGIFSDGLHEPRPPFQRGVRNAETVLSRIVDAATVDPGRESALLAAVAASRGFVPVGPMTEVYLGDPAAPDARVEIQMSVRREVAEIEAVASSDPEAATTVPGRPPNESTDEVVTLGELRSVFGDVIGESGDKTDDEPVKELPKLAVNAKPAGHRSETSASALAEKPPSKSATDVVTGEEVSQKLSAGEYADLAKELVPPGRIIDQTTQIWLVQVGSRLGAAARGVEKTQLDPGGRLAGLHQAMQTRMDEAFGRFKPDYRDTAMVWMRMQDDPALAGKRAVLRDLDVLLTRIGTRSIDATGLGTGLSETMARAIIEVSGM